MSRWSPLAPALACALVACSGEPPQQTQPTVTDTDTSEPKVLPIDTSVFIPEDTAPDVAPDLVPDHWVYLEQQGVWNLGSSSPPYNNLTGNLRIRERIDVPPGPGGGPTTGDTGGAYECDVRYTLTGTEVTSHSCSSCDFVMDVEHYVNTGDPTACHDPDAPPSGAIWQFGFDSGQSTIFLNYYGTGVWVPWYDATKVGATVDFEWSATLAIEVEDTGDN